MQLTASTLERCFEARQLGPGFRECPEMARKEVAILKRAQRHLRSPDRRRVLRRVGDAQFSGNLQRIPKLLRREANTMEALWHVDGAGLGNGLAEAGRPTRKPGGQHAPPRTAGTFRD